MAAKRRRVVCCDRCGAAKILGPPKKPGEADPACGQCHGVQFSAERKIPWQPFALGWQSQADAQFLKSLRIQSARAEKEIPDPQV